MTTPPPCTTLIKRKTCRDIDMTAVGLTVEDIVSGHKKSPNLEKFVTIMSPPRKKPRESGLVHPT
jgi:hypothetical protein